MGKVNRFKFESTPKRMLIDRKMLSKFNIRNIKSAKNTIYFTIVNPEDNERVKNFLAERGIEISPLKKNGTEDK